MAVQRFETFAKTISRLPSECVLKALDMECKMLETDNEHRRLDAIDDALSIFSFRQFLRMAREGQAMQCVRRLPPDHIEFYKETIVRLVHAGEIPKMAMDQFDYTFVSAVNS
ncbi:MAG TPA: hypothetical protein VMF08_04375 [Candidatus Sulfotelmatobacter sp.]|nr:hypothetical protein [Candidatus Sulfotelmatobacter sp.]